MIKRTFIVAVGLFILYNLALLPESMRVRFHPQSQWQSNIIKAQSHVIGDNRRPAVIVGSSQAARLVGPAALGPEFENLAFSGDGPLTGLMVVLKCPAVPQVVVIETNHLLRAVNEDVLSSAFRPVVAPLRSAVPALREQYQPANFIAAYAGERLLHYGISGVRRVAARLRTRGHSVPSAHTLDEGGTDDLFSLNLANQRVELSKEPDAAELGRRMRLLKACVSELEYRGATCVLLEMPVDKSLENLAFLSAIRRNVSQAFADSPIPWIRPEKGRQYRTTDGIHLPGEEARAYTDWILSELERLGVLPL